VRDKDWRVIPGGLPPKIKTLEEMANEDGPLARMAKGLDDPFPRLDIAGIKRVPEVDWAVDNMIPRSEVGILSGHGGTGKSKLASQLACCCVIGNRDWIRQMPATGPAIVVAGEDSDADATRNLEPVRRFYDVPFEDLAAGGLIIHPMAGKDAFLAVKDDNDLIRPTRLYADLFAEVRDMRPVVTVIDNIGMTFGGNENDRVQVVAFLSLLKAIALEGETAVILLAHPSLAGLSTGTGLSGSTAWHNSVRWRAWLRGVRKGGEAYNAEDGLEKEPEDVDPDLRELEFLKIQYGPAVPVMKLKWQDGTFQPVPRPGEIERMQIDYRIKQMFLAAMERFAMRAQNISSKLNAENYAPRVFVKMDEGVRKARMTLGNMERAMNLLFEAGEIKSVPYKEHGKERQRLVRVRDSST
jgi:RecA-family ATPase